MDDFKALLIQQLEDLDDAEKQWSRALPGFAEAAQEPKLRQALEAENKRAGGDADRLHSAFRILGVAPQSRPSQGMRGLIDQARESIRAAASLSPRAHDAALIIAVQKIKHYEICAYGCARELAERIGDTEVARLMEETKLEEREFDRRLTAVVPKAA